MCDFKEIIIGIILLGLLILLLVGLEKAYEAEYSEYIQLCQENGYTEIQCELRHKELELSRRYESQAYISPGTGIVK